MPRISPKEFLRARAVSPVLLSLLPVCRDLVSARHELRWLTEHATHVSSRIRLEKPSHVLRDFVARRAGGEPLQYILGSEFFGELEIKCRPGVLIPRQETAASISFLASLFRHSPKKDSALRVLDLCTGTGCIPLLFHHEFYKDAQQQGLLELVGVDISSQALSLARENLLLQITAQAQSSSGHVQQTLSLRKIGFVQADILRQQTTTRLDEPLPLLQALERLSGNLEPPIFDILISNPPYISPHAFMTSTSRSVRAYEPKLALVPPGVPSLSDTARGDSFYPKLLRFAEELGVKAFLFEVADLAQAKRVIAMTKGRGVWDEVQIWRDEPGASPGAAEEVVCDGMTIKVRGAGHGRSVFAYRDDPAALFKEI